MSDLGPTINVSADALEYLTQKFLKLFGRDDDSLQLGDWFRALQTTALKQTEDVKCVGMRTPLSFDNIYQPTRLLVGADPDEASSTESYAHSDKVSRSILRARELGTRAISIEEFLQRDQDALIFGGPGWGKTTLLHHIFRSTTNRPDLLPVLITLRRPNAVAELEKYVKACSRISKKAHGACTLLLVDGYDEVNSAERKRVSEALLQFGARGAGKYYLTCRDYYQVPLLNAPEVRLDGFTRNDQVRFVGVFLSKFAIIKDDPEIVVSQLEERGFSEFLSHPLLLTLACIVRTSSTTTQPRSALRLLEQAINVLCFRWDEQKTIAREPLTQLDGNDRIVILEHIALRSRSPYVVGYRAEEIARTQLGLMGMDKVDPREALLEIARFYGILVPAEDGYEFVHRTIHDFLAARLWVSSGEFATQPKYEWNARTGYAACRMRDATEILKRALEAGEDGLPTVTEIIGNAASFSRPMIADALISFFSGTNRIVEYERHADDEVARKYSPRIIGRLTSDFIRLANSRFLDFIVEYCSGKHSHAADLLVTYAAVELYERRLKLAHQTYDKALACYKTDNFTFVISGGKQTKLDFLNPVPKNRMKDYSGTSGDGTT